MAAPVLGGTTTCEGHPEPYISHGPRHCHCPGTDGRGATSYPRKGMTSLGCLVTGRTSVQASALRLGSTVRRATCGDALTTRIVPMPRSSYSRSGRNQKVLVSPFLRLHLVGQLQSAGISGIDRQLVSKVARRCTDMRLLRNMCNEYFLFAQRLLNSTKVAPGLTPSTVFALVAYRSFQLKDFEDNSRRASPLDGLYDLRRGVVRHFIEGLEMEKRDLISGAEPNGGTATCGVDTLKTALAICASSTPNQRIVGLTTSGCEVRSRSPRNRRSRGHEGGRSAFPSPFKTGLRRS